MQEKEVTMFEPLESRLMLATLIATYAADFSGLTNGASFEGNFVITDDAAFSAPVRAFSYVDLDGTDGTVVPIDLHIVETVAIDVGSQVIDFANLRATTDAVTVLNTPGSYSFVLSSNVRLIDAQLAEQNPPPPTLPGKRLGWLKPHNPHFCDVLIDVLGARSKGEVLS
jgi:hypothetical protein